MSNTSAVTQSPLTRKNESQSLLPGLLTLRGETRLLSGKGMICLTEGEKRRKTKGPGKQRKEAGPLEVLEV